MVIADYSFIDALFMATITISTVGFSIISPLNLEGKIFTIFLILSSISIFASIITYVSRYFFDGNFRTHLTQLKMENKIKKLKNHVVICGFGRNGKAAVNELVERNEKFVVVEEEEDRIDYLKTHTDYLYIKGNATNKEIISKLNLEKAKALILALPSDSDNLFILLSARKINRGLRIISRVSKPESEEILRTAGSNHIIMPDRLGGKQMASLVTHENVIEFVEYLLIQNKDEVNIESIFINKRKKNFKDFTINDIQKLNDTGAIIIGTKDVFNNFIYNPSPDILLVEQQYIYVLGSHEQIENLNGIIYN
jgi:voltage-gated potassium channel